MDPEVLLVDEVLAVGDEAFTRKCLDKIGEFRRRGKTIVIVTHSLGLVEKLCDDILWLRHGRVAARLCAETISSVSRTARGPA